MSRLYCYLFAGIIAFGSLGVALLKHVGLIDYSFFVAALPSHELYALALVHCITYTLGLFAFRRMLGLNRVVLSTERATIALPARIAVMVIAFACVYALFYVWIDSALLTAKVSFRHSGNELFRRLSLIVFLAGIFVTAMRPTLTRAIPLALLLFAATLYPAADAGRSVAIPFLVAGATMFYNRHRVPGGAMILAGVIALASALESRNLPSYANFWATFGDIVASGDPLRIARPVVQNSFPGLDTISVMAVKAQQSSTVSFYDLLAFLAYYSPAPSGLFPPHFFEQTSLNGILGISLDVVGLNSDLYSEPLFWFGYPGMVIVPLLLAFMTCVSFWSAQALFRTASRRTQLVAAIPVMWMLVGGMVFSLRAGSRFVWAILLAALAVKAVRLLSRSAPSGRKGVA